MINLQSLALTFVKVWEPWISCVAMAVRDSTHALPALPSNSFNCSFQIESFTSYHANEICVAVFTDAMNLRNGVLVGLSNSVLFLILLFCLHEG